MTCLDAAPQVQQCLVVDREMKPTATVHLGPDWMYLTLTISPIASHNFAPICIWSSSIFADPLLRSGLIIAQSRGKRAQEAERGTK